MLWEKLYTKLWIASNELYHTKLWRWTIGLSIFLYLRWEITFEIGTHPFLKNCKTGTFYPFNPITYTILNFLSVLKTILFYYKFKKIIESILVIFTILWFGWIIFINFIFLVLFFSISFYIDTECVCMIWSTMDLKHFYKMYVLKSLDKLKLVRFFCNILTILFTFHVYIIYLWYLSNF